MTDRELMQMALDALFNLRWAASERDKKNRIRQFDEFMDNSDETIEALRARLAQPEQDDGYCQACDGNHCTAKNGCVALDNPRAQPEPEELGEVIPADEEQLKRIAKLVEPEPEPVAWVAYENGEKHGIDFDEDEIAELPVGTMLYTAPPHFLDPAKVARLIDEAFERGKKEIDMEQVKDIVHKLADCALLNSAPPQREWMERERAVGYREGHQAALKQREWQGLTDEEIENFVQAVWPREATPTDYILAIEAKLKEKNT